jgi:DNA-binding MarR family transcriptional regulator
VPQTAIRRATLSSDQARLALPPRAKPYWHICVPGAHLGYYKGSRGGVWYGRKFIGEGKYTQTKLGPAREAGGKGAHGLTFDAAVKELLRWAAADDSAPSRRQRATAQRASPMTEQLKPNRVDAISQAWAHERPDVDFWLAAFFLRMEYAHVLHDRRIQQVAKEAGTNVGDLHVLLALRRNGPDNAMRPTELYRTLLVTSGAITKRLDNLRAQKLIERAAATEDRRSELVKLTKRGRAVADAAMSRITSSLEEIVKASGLRRAELRRVDECLRRLISAM